LRYRAVLVLSLLLHALFAGPPAPIELSLVGGESQLVHEGVRLHGLPVRGAYEVVAVAPDGSRRRVAARTHGPARLHPHEARVDAEQARTLAAAQLVLSHEQLEPQLVYLRTLEQAVLAWEVTSPLDLSGPPKRERIWLSASTGALLARRSLVFDSGALVYPENPATTPVPIMVEFETVDVALPDVPLSSPTFEVHGCVDAPEDPNEPAPGWWSEGMCFPHARARSDENGDYFVPLPDIGLIADNEAFDDLYAEVAAYWYVERFFAGMTARGLTSARCEHFSVAVNRYTLNSEGERMPSGGANFVDECDNEASPTLIIGQGRYVDYAYDSDIIFHEMAHSVIQHLSPDGLADRQLTPRGILSEAGALNEGLADYFAITLSGDPEVGEYIGRYSVDLTTPFIRSGENDKVCPDDLVGQWHNDGLIVSGALWSANQRVGGEVVDAILLETLPRLEPDASLEDFGRTFLTVAGEFREAGELAPEGFELIERGLAGRGLLDCEHVITDVELTTDGKRMAMVADDDSIAPFAPGPLQLRYEVPPGESEVTVFFTVSVSGIEEEPALSVLMRTGGEPITFTYELIDDVIVVDGDWGVEVAAESLNGEDYIARLPVTAGDVLHVSLANRSPGGASISNFFVVASDVDEVPDEPGCACTSTARDQRGDVLIMTLLGLLGITSVRRRGMLRRCAG
jgi:MYXO-CTERM domain-containing protein